MKYLFLFAISLISNFALAFEPLPKQVEHPKDNPPSKAKVELGRILFFDPRLSLDGTISCNSCHNVMSSGEDNRPNSVGVRGQKGGRSAPTVWNAAFQSVQFWDGRAPTLEEQAKGPLTNPIEMGMPNHELVVERIVKLSEYVQLFKNAFPDEVKKGSDIKIDQVAKAIASYERTLITLNSPFDRYVLGDKKALSSQALAGMKRFQEVGCVTCHSGPNFSGPKLSVGTGFFMKFPLFKDNPYNDKYELSKDPGRYEVTKPETDRNFWRVPTLRNVALTAPYFHNGSVANLDEAVRVMAKTQLNKNLSDSEVKELVHFLESLTGRFPVQSLPRLPDYIGTTFTKTQ